MKYYFHTIKSILNLIGISDCNFHTIKSILNFAQLRIFNSTIADFHTIKSILNQEHSNLSVLLCLFPYY